MKKIITLLILFSPSYFFAQSIKVDISPYPNSLNSIMKQFETASKENYEFKKGSTKYKISQKGGSYGYLSTYENGSSWSTTSLHMHYVKGDRDKGNVLIKDKENKDKKVGGFKVKTGGSSGNTAMAFSTDGKYAVVIGMEDKDNLVYVYLFNLETRKLEVKEKPIKVDSNPRRLYMVGYSGSGDFVYTTDKYGWIQVLNLKTGNGKTYPFGELGNNPKYVFPSKTSNHLLVANDDKRVLVDGETGNVLMTSGAGVDLPKTKSFFIGADGTVTKSISGKSIKGPGIGVIARPNSLMVFDQDFNYFTQVDEKDSHYLAPEDRDNYLITDFVTLGGEAVELQPDPIPIVADVLSDPKIKTKFLQEADRLCSTCNSDPSIYAMFESAEPIEDETIEEIVVGPTPFYYIDEYLGKRVIEKILDTPIAQLAEDGKKTNERRKDFLGYVKKGYEKPENNPIIGIEPQALADAENKIGTLAGDLYYMTPMELVQKGNEAVTTGAKLSPTAALLGIKFYEVAAMKEPNDPVYPCLIGNAYANANKYDQALENYNKALAMRPDYPLALFGIMKTSFVPVQNGQKNLDDNLAKSIIGNADRFLVVAPEDYVPEMTTAKRYKAFCQLYLDDKNLYAQYNMATGLQNAETRANAVSGLLLPVEKTGNKYLAADMANVIGFDLINVAESKNHDKAEYLKADAMLAKSVKGGINDAQTYYNWAQININQLGRSDEGLRIIEEAKKLYPLDANFDVLAVNLYYNKGRELYLAKSYGKAIPYFEKYVFTAANPILKAHDYLGLAYYRTKSYDKAAKSMQKLKDGEKWNTLQAHYPNFNALLAYAKNPVGTAPTIQDNTDAIIAAEDKYEKGIDMQGNEGLRLMLDAANYYDEINYDYGQGIAHSGVGVWYHKAGDTYSAKKHYKKCIENGAQSASCYSNISKIYLKEEDLNGAYTYVMDGINKFPNDQQMRYAYAEYYIQLGFKEYGNKSYYAAITNFKKCIKYNDSDAWAHMYLGYSYYATGSLSKAKSSLRSAIQLDPKLRSDYPAIGQILNQ